jgi:hypothetical protein
MSFWLFRRWWRSLGCSRCHRGGSHAGAAYRGLCGGLYSSLMMLGRKLVQFCVGPTTTTPEGVVSLLEVLL